MRRSSGPVGPESWSGLTKSGGTTTGGGLKSWATNGGILAKLCRVRHGAGTRAGAASSASSFSGCSTRPLSSSSEGETSISLCCCGCCCGWWCWLDRSSMSTSGSASAPPSELESRSTSSTLTSSNELVQWLDTWTPVLAGEWAVSDWGRDREYDKNQYSRILQRGLVRLIHRTWTWWEPYWHNWGEE